MSGEDAHLEADYEDRNGYPDDDDGSDWDSDIDIDYGPQFGEEE